jgi:ATP-dependent DNA ligase
MRNYRAMNPDKLVKCYMELQLRSGDAYDRVVAKGEDLESHENAAMSAMVAKGLAVEEAEEPASPRPAADTPPPAYIPPQLAFDANGDLGFVPEASRDAWVMEPKWDGWRWQVHITEAGVRSIGGRNGKEHDGAPAIDAILMEQLPAGTILDGEMIWEDGLPSNRLASYVAFDILAVAGSHVYSRPWHERRRLLEAALDGVVGQVSIAPYGPVDDYVLDRWLELGMEGCVLKRKDAPYRPGSRRRDGFVKVKPQATTDAIVTGYVMGKGASNRDLVGALEITLVDTNAETTTGWGGTVEEAQAMVGLLVEVAHYGWMPSGKVRHPIFKRTRPDLDS